MNYFRIILNRFVKFLMILKVFCDFETEKDIIINVDLLNALTKNDF